MRFWSVWATAWLVTLLIAPGQGLMQCFLIGVLIGWVSISVARLIVGCHGHVGEQFYFLRHRWGFRREKMLWREASTVEDVGALTVAWLTGDSRYNPGYPVPAPDDETLTHPGLLDTLVALNRSGLWTVASQPFTVMDGGFVQRAAIDIITTQARADVFAARVTELDPDGAVVVVANHGRARPSLLHDVDVADFCRCHTPRDGAIPVSGMWDGGVFEMCTWFGPVPTDCLPVRGLSVRMQATVECSLVQVTVYQPQWADDKGFFSVIHESLSVSDDDVSARFGGAF